MESAVRRWVLIGSIAVVVLSPSAAFAGGPAGWKSTTPACLVVCPQGDVVSTVIARDPADNAVANSVVVIDFSLCPGFVLCPPDGRESYVIKPGPRLVGITNAVGRADFSIRACGTCLGSVTITADNRALAQYTGVVSPDQNGDQLVDNADEVLLEAKIGTRDVTGDLDCNHLVDSSDIAILRAHLGHASQHAVPVEPRTWGALKLIYR